MNDEVEQAYEECLKLAHSHYENFPVASLLVPKPLRKPIAAVYLFARLADDIADESPENPEQKIAELNAMSEELNSVLAGNPPNRNHYHAVHDAITRFNLTPQYFHDLVDAFKQDVTKQRYENFEEVLDYCRRSANPVGRLLLELTGNNSERNLEDSDRICSALQLINFMQDIQQDLKENNRIYFPQDEMRAAGISDEDFIKGSTEPHVVEFIRLQTERAKSMLEQGAPLGKRLSGRFGLEIRTITQGGLAICNALLQQGVDIYSRPRLSGKDKIMMLAKAALGIS